ncbi:MAG: SLC13/DASS family transporter [Candidatus Omnitrophica bacterium]|nr:SLC13/DASS family transporter [Candidatus Omnitrophota bacterium]
MAKPVNLLISTLIPVLIWLLPAPVFPLENLTVIEQRILAIFALACLYWVLEPIPIYATSLLVIFLELVLVSDQGFALLQADKNSPEFGSLLDYKEILGTFSSPIIILFLGGFFLAMATSKYRLDINLARVLLKPFGTNPCFILLGVMILTALFSMFMSNTATTAMMFAIIHPVLKSFPPDDKGRMGVILGIPFAANIGGIGTPIGTPPNAIALKYLTGPDAISFGEWMGFALPYVLFMLGVVWIVLLRRFPFQTREVNLTIEGQFLKHGKAMVLYITFAVTILLWLTESLHGMNAYVVAVIPVAVLSITQVITKEDLKRISWDVLWLVAGGIALGMGLEKSGLSRNLVESIPFQVLSPTLIVLICSLFTYAIANFMSHTAAANLVLPIVAALSLNLDSLAPLGGARLLVLTVAFTASLSMVLPISTPPNAIAYASGLITTRDMSAAGLLIGLLGLGAIYLLMYILRMVHYL